MNPIHIFIYICICINVHTLAPSSELEKATAIMSLKLPCVQFFAFMIYLKEKLTLSWLFKFNIFSKYSVSSTVHVRQIQYKHTVCMHVRKMYVIKDVIIKGKYVSQKCTCAGYF